MSRSHSSRLPRNPSSAAVLKLSRAVISRRFPLFVSLTFRQWRRETKMCDASGYSLAQFAANKRSSSVRFFRHEKEWGHTVDAPPAPTARRVPTETGFKLRAGSELTTIERLPVCNLGDHFWSEWGERQSALAAADSVQTKIPRHGPMIRRVRAGDGRPRRRQALRKHVVKGCIWKTMSPRVGYSLR
jgi:hypothetical protein